MLVAQVIGKDIHGVNPPNFQTQTFPQKSLSLLMLYLLIEMYTSSYFSPCISIDVTQFEGPKTYDTP